MARKIKALIMISFVAVPLLAVLIFAGKVFVNPAQAGRTLESSMSAVLAAFSLIELVVIARQRARLATFERRYEAQRTTIRHMKEAGKKKPKKKGFWDD